MRISGRVVAHDLYDRLARQLAAGVANVREHHVLAQQPAEVQTVEPDWQAEGKAREPMRR